MWCFAHSNIFKIKLSTILLADKDWNTGCLCKNNNITGLPRWLSGKESTCQFRRHRFDPWVGRSPSKGNCNPLQYSCLENPMDRMAWQATVHGVAKELDMTQLSNNIITMIKLSVTSNFLLSVQHSTACRTLAPQSGIEPGPLHWKRRALTAGLQGIPYLFKIVP